MRTRRLTLGLACAVMIVIAGCPQQASQGNILTFGIKAARGTLTQATATEWQTVANTVSSRVADINVSLTDEQAQAIVDFLVENDLNTIQAITDLVAQFQADPNSINQIVIPDSLMDLFGDGASFEHALGEI